MSDINKANAAELNLEELQIDYLSGQGAVNGTPCLGIEIESWFFNAPDGEKKVKMMSPDKSQELLRRLAVQDKNAQVFYESGGLRYDQPKDGAPIVCVVSNGISYQLELCGVLEAATDPFAPAEVNSLLDKIDEAQNSLRMTAGGIGLVEYPCAVPGSVTVQDCEENMVQRERLRAEWAKFKSEGPNSAGLRTMGLSASTQVNLSYKDAQEAWEIMTLANILSPVLYAVFSNTTGYTEGVRSDSQIPRADWWLQHNISAPRGGIPAPVLRAMRSGKKPELMIKEWINYVSNTPMVYYIDSKGKPQFSLSPTFNDLAKQSLGTRANFLLAESLVWPDVKLIGGKRIELRMCDTGDWQPAALTVIAATLFLDSEARGLLLRALSDMTDKELLQSRKCVGSLGLPTPLDSRRTLKDILPLLKETVEAGVKKLGIRSGKWQRLMEVLETGVCDTDVIRSRQYKDAKTSDIKLML